MLSSATLQMLPLNFKCAVARLDKPKAEAEENVHFDCDIGNNNVTNIYMPKTNVP
jgi:hypothetical protein